MSETTINQRLNFLLKELGMKAGPFARALDLSETTIRNYVDRTAKPSSDVLEKIANTFRQVNLVWLITGEGEPFFPDSLEASVTQTGNFNQAGTGNAQKIKGNKNNVQNNSGDHAKITNNVQLENCKRDLATAEKELQHLRDRLAAAEALVASKDVTIASKEETISVLRAAFNRPN